MSAAPTSLENPPKTPRKEARNKDYRLSWSNQTNLSKTFEAERRKQQLREAEKIIYARRRREVEERFLWLRKGYVIPPLDGPHPQPNGEILYL